MSTTRKGSKEPSPDDLALWERAMKDAKPLRKRAPRPPPPIELFELPRAAPARPRNAVPAPKGPLGADGAMEKRLRRGAIEPDATLDLHGETQTRAYDRLIRFLGVAEATGRRSILVITGKGRPKTDAERDADWQTSQARGVLRRVVPYWLKEPPFRDRVLAVRPAHMRHGGGGAFYVILRRPRGEGRER